MYLLQTERLLVVVQSSILYLHMLLKHPKNIEDESSEFYM